MFFSVAYVIALLVCSILLRVVSRPSNTFDGTATVNFEADGMGSSGSDEFTTTVQQEQSGDTLSSSQDSGVVQATGGLTSFEVTFYHCTAGSFWNATVSGADDGLPSSCELCTGMAEGDVEVLRCVTRMVCLVHPLLHVCFSSLALLIIRGTLSFISRTRFCCCFLCR